MSDVEHEKVSITLKRFKHLQQVTDEFYNLGPKVRNQRLEINRLQNKIEDLEVEVARGVNRIRELENDLEFYRSNVYGTLQQNTDYGISPFK